MQTAAGSDPHERTEEYLWQVPGKPLSVRLSQTVVRAILKRGKRRFGRGFETGGILLGRASTEAGGLVVHVEEAVEVPSEHLFGPRYSLSEGDKELCQEVLDESARGATPLRPVGFYRTHTRPGLALDSDDQELMQEFFPGPDCVALVVKRRRFGRSRAGFFFWEDGQLHPEASYQELALRAGRAPAPRAARRRAGPLWCSWWLQIPLLACLLAADALLGYVSARQWNEHIAVAPPPRDPYALSLMVLEYVDNLHLSWDRRARPIENGGKGLLHIADGGQTRTLELSSEQLKSGSVIYRKMTPQVRFRLEVFLGGGRSVSETWDSGLAAAAAKR
jgi:hypothetical protein